MPSYPPPREPVHVLVGARRSGKTSALIRWQAQGTPRPQWPKWSRVILVGSAQMERVVGDHIRRMFDDIWTPQFEERVRNEVERENGFEMNERAQAMMRQRAEIAMCTAILTAGSAQLGRLRGADVEIAVDNADDILAQMLGIALPRQLTLTGKGELL